MANECSVPEGCVDRTWDSCSEAREVECSVEELEEAVNDRKLLVEAAGPLASQLWNADRWERALETRMANKWKQERYWH